MHGRLQAPVHVYHHVRFITFRVSRGRREMYIRHARLSVRDRMPALLHGAGCNSDEW